MLNKTITRRPTTVESLDKFLNSVHSDKLSPKQLVKCVSMLEFELSEPNSKYTVKYLMGIKRKLIEIYTPIIKTNNND